MSEEKRMIDDYEVVEAVNVGGREIALCQNHKLPQAYLVAYIEHNILFETYTVKTVTDNPLEAYEVFSDQLYWEVRERREKLSHFQQLQRLGVKHCVLGGMDENLQGKVVILNPEALPIDKQVSPYQLGLAYGGFGCSPIARGRAVMVDRLSDGASKRWERDEILGVADPEQLPEWAKKRLEIVRAAQEKSTKQQPER